MVITLTLQPATTGPVVDVTIGPIIIIVYNVFYNYKALNCFSIQCYKGILGEASTEIEKKYLLALGMLDPLLYEPVISS